LLSQEVAAPFVRVNARGVAYDPSAR
jgi:hypothetical protein